MEVRDWRRRYLCYLLIYSSSIYEIKLSWLVTIIYYTYLWGVKRWFKVIRVKVIDLFWFGNLLKCSTIPAVIWVRARGEPSSLFKTVCRLGGKFRSNNTANEDCGSCDGKPLTKTSCSSQKRKKPRETIEPRNKEVYISYNPSEKGRRDRATRKSSTLSSFLPPPAISCTSSKGCHRGKSFGKVYGNRIENKTSSPFGGKQLSREIYC